MIEWVGPIKPKKEGEKAISASEGKEVQGKSHEKKPDFTNFEVFSPISLSPKSNLLKFILKDIMNDIDENVEINDQINQKSASPIDKNGLF